VDVSFFAVMLPFRVNLRKGSFYFSQRGSPNLRRERAFIHSKNHVGGETELMVDKRIGIIGIVIEDLACAERVNEVLHEYAELVIGRMGIPYRQRGVSVISLIVDGSNDDISALTGKLGRISGASVKSMITKNVQ
jgi:putative iron-only hydrogenase system regulator